MDFFNDGSGKHGFSLPSFFQWLTAIENGGTSLYRTQAAEKLRFSTACYALRHFL